MPKLNDIKTTDGMIAFLKEKGGNHNNYYHYTNWDSLTKIMQNKTFLLTRGNSLGINDQSEALMKGSWSEWNKIYIGSFAYGSNENMAMWGLYGLPWQDAVRICISKEKMIQWLKSIKQVKIFYQGKPIDYQESFEASLNDIVYIEEIEDLNIFKLYHNNNISTVSITSDNRIDIPPKMTGYIKNNAWKYENEVRLRIRLAHDTGYEKISIVIPDDVIDSISITTGPYFRWKNDKFYQKLLNEKRIVESEFKNLVNYRELCDMCQHSFTQKD